MKILANWSAKSNEQGGLLPTPLTRRHLAALGVVEELKQRLQKRLAARRSKEQISARARELWEQHGRPAGRDEEFWLQAESELRKNGSE
jgi:hypothetical protein